MSANVSKNIWETAVNHSEMQNVRSSTLVRGDTVKITTQLICDSQQTNVKTTITIKYNKLIQILFVTASTI